MDKISILKDYFQQRYLGRDSFLENVIFPIWGKENFEDKYDQEMVTEDLKTVANATGITSVTNVGEIGLPSCNDLYIYDIRVADRIKMMRNRVGIQQLIRRIMPTYSCAFMLFHYDNYDNWDWRFTFCRRGSRDELTDSKRFTFMLGPHQSCRTVAENFAKLMEKGEGADDKDIEGAFDVEALSDEFFTKYKQHYERFVEFITGKKFVKKGGKWEETVSHEPHAVYYPAFNCDDKLVRDYVKKLLGRIVFLHFLQKKGWLGVPENDSWGDGDQDFMLHLFENAADWQKDDFLDCVLEPLFSEALDTDRGKKSIFDTDVPIMGSTRMRIPYLNGGLFEKDECDKKNIQFPSELFQSLFNFLSQYNFTIDENDPDDAQVGVDPEMLGRIFENLLEDNKDKGAFYTPKEIVRYMCRQSLIAYLNTNITDEAKQKAIETFVKTYDVKALNDVDAHLAQQVDEQLKNVKICDPAIGSGAFPMGLLKELFLCRGAIENFDNAADIKRHIIQNNIYGVDIERGAVDIARLRFWLSLVVDETEPQTLPNLDFKIMQGNSLLESYQGEDLSKIAATKQEKAEGVQMTFFDDTLDVLRKQLNDKISQYYGEADHQKKAHLVAEIHDNIKQQLKDTGCSVDLSNINIQANDQFFLWHTWFSDVFNRPSDCNGGGGFDVVIGNPPYVRRTSINEGAKKWYEKYFSSATKQYDLYLLFIEKGFSVLRNKGIEVYINPIRFFNSDYGVGARRLIIKENSLKRVLNVSQIPVFANALTYPCILQIEKSEANNSENVIQYLKLNGLIELSSIDKVPVLEIRQGDIQSDPDCKIIVDVNPKLIPIIKKMDSSKRIVDYFDIARGLANSKVDFNTPLYKALKSTNVRKYFIDGEIQNVSTNYANVFSEEMIILPRTVAFLQATLKEKNIICLDRIYYLKEKLKLEKNYFLGVLNSFITNVWFEYYYSTTKVAGNYFDLNGNQIASIPIPTATSAQQQEIVTLVDKILLAKKQDSACDTTDLEREIDRLVYELYGLTEEEIMIVESC